MEKLDVLVVDGGARGHAIASKVVESPLLNEVWVTHDGPGIEDVAQIARDPDGETINPTDIRAVINFVTRQNIDLVIPSADEPLCQGGITNVLQDLGVKVFGPTKSAARLEGSKLLMHEIAGQRDVPTAEYATPNGRQELLAYCREATYPLVLKQDGLGQRDVSVVICREFKEVERLVKHSHNGLYFVEEYLEGPELSLHAFVDGKSRRMMPFAMQDHKFRYAGDKGKMTGGMGVVGPVPNIGPSEIEKLAKRFVDPFIEAQAEVNEQFVGVIFAGLKLTTKGPKLLEINARPGYPETGVWIPKLDSDLLAIAQACIGGTLHELRPIIWNDNVIVDIEVPSVGYPEVRDHRSEISGLKDVNALPNIRVYAGAAKYEDEEIIATGGRALSIVATGTPEEGLEAVIKRDYQAVELLKLDNKRPTVRKDIGQTAMSLLMKERIDIMKKAISI